MTEEILTTEEAARFLNVSEVYIRKLVTLKEIAVIKRGRRYTRFRKSDLLSFLDRYTVKKETQQ